MWVQIENINYNFVYQSSNVLPDEDNIGLAHLLIPSPMAERFRKECGWKDNEIMCIPHYGSEEMESSYIKGSQHECYNSDTQIVLMHWLHNKRRKYHLEYQGLDPFWLFHDHFHSKHDVSGYEVGGVTSRIEKTRLMQGAEYAFENGIYIKPETVAKLDGAWNSRWKLWEGNGMTALDTHEFYQFMEPEDVDEVEELIELGIYE